MSVNYNNNGSLEKIAGRAEAEEPLYAKYSAPSGSVSITADTWYTLTSITLEKAGTYLINYHARFPTTNIYMNGGVATSQVQIFDFQDQSGTGIFGYMNGNKIITVNANTTLYFRASTSGQNSTADGICLSAIKIA